MQNRRTLHQPFFPLPSTTPPPNLPPTPSPPYPKYPFSTNPTPPFFPNYPSPPSPPTPTTTPSSSSSLPTFPANISSLIYPNTSPQHPHPSKLLPALLFSIISLSLLILVSAFLFHRRHRRKDQTPPHKLTATSPPPPPPPPAAAAAVPSDFLYLGTLVSSRNNSGAQTHLPHHNAGSPELRPLPPLSREFPLPRAPAAPASAGSDGPDEFYSPQADSKAASDTIRALRSFSSTTSYPTSSGSAVSSPDQSSPVLVSSPAKSSASVSSMPPPIPPPPPPPPPPPFGYWENQIRKPPVLAPPPKRVSEDSPGEPVEDTPRTKLKPLHWDKVRASSDRAMVWDQLKSSSFQ